MEKNELRCYFCGKPIIEKSGKKTDSLAIHHLDGNHDNDIPENRAECHYGCHSKYHSLTEDGQKRWEAVLKIRHSFTSEETKLKLSKAMKGKSWHPYIPHIFSEEARKKLSERNIGNKFSLGYRFSAEAKRKFSEMQKGERNSRYGAKLSKEHKEALRRGYQKYRESQS
jgi:hypothetical protein